MDTENNNKKVIFYTEEEEWLNMRFNYITGTDLGRILGIDKNMTRRGLLITKVYRKNKIFTNPKTLEIMELGRDYEIYGIYAFEEYMRKRGYFIGKRVFDKFFLIHEPYFGGTPDAIYLQSGVLLEVKTHHIPTSLLAKPYQDVNEIPLKYFLQVQHYLNLTEYEGGYLISWTVANGFTVFYMERDIELLNHLILPKSIEFHRWMRDIDNFDDNIKLARSTTAISDKIIKIVTKSLINSTRIVK